MFQPFRYGSVKTYFGRTQLVSKQVTDAAWYNIIKLSDAHTPYPLATRALTVCIHVHKINEYITEVLDEMHRD